MNDAPPPLTPSSTQPQYQVPAKSGCGGKSALGCSFGCLAMVVILGIAGYFAFVAIKNKAGEMIVAYTSDQPVLIEVPQVSEAEITSAAMKLEAFRVGMREGGSSAPLYLSENEMNALIMHHPSFKELAGKGSVSIEDDQLHTRVSLKLDDLDIPIPFLADAVEGRYFNGEASLSLGMSAGRPALYIEGLAVNGNAIPDEFIGELRKKNLFEEIKDNQEMDEFFGKVEAMGIEGNQLFILPKGSQ